MSRKSGAPRPRLLCLMQLPPPIHGATLVNEQVARSEVLRERFRVEVLPLRFAGSIGDIGHVSVGKLGRALLTAIRLAGGLAFRRPDAVYFTLAPAGGAFYRDCLFVGIMKACGVRRIYHMHGSGVAPRLDSAWRRALYAWTFRGARLIHVSPRLAPDTAAVADGPVYYVPNGIPAAPPVERAPAAVPRVLYLSSIHTEKGPFVLLDALAQLHARGIAFEATFAGAVGERRCLPAFEERLARPDLRERVRYVGATYGAARDALYREHDVFVLPSFREACPLVVLEAMRAGLPVIATGEGALPEMVEEGASGYLVPRGDAGALAARLEALLADAPARRRLGARGRERFLEHYTLERFERTLADALAACLRQAAPVREGMPAPAATSGGARSGSLG